VLAVVVVAVVVLAVIMVSVPPLILKFREKNLKKFEKSILKQVVVCLCAVYISEKFEKKSSRSLLMCCIYI
jgi:flagellar biosynthesis component FlhA